MTNSKFLLFIICFVSIISCSKKTEESYGYKVNKIAAKTKVFELISKNGDSRIAIAPKIQGKILTSTYSGFNGASNGWLNSNIFDEENPDLAAIGGEERVWFGPLGGQHSFYYQQKKPLSEDNWQVPKSLSTEAYKLKLFTKEKIVMSKKMKLTNFIGTQFDFEVFRKIKLINKEQLRKNLSLKINKNLMYVGYETEHSIQNLGKEKWTKETGLVSIWSAGMFKGSDKSVVILPLTKDVELDSIYQYMGKLDKSRLQIKNKTVLFKADGKYRSKIGIPNKIATPIYGCYIKEKQQLIIVQYHQTTHQLFSNSKVSIQNNPYLGEVIPIYNNGPMDYAKTNETSFFELESTSPFLELEPYQYSSHYHRVYHFSGDENELNKISEQLLGIALKDCSL
ncbi:hypothetical protein BW723_03855 [Polaribacter reichenbachii]|uniref:Lipoprotein n=1 Tax=Polaribacter reichenbachii TaxID=996801 RepID=A0A1B8TUY3_9FLAO|nr:DUF6786 family protein [Polaribacter reichenbachii]APZ45484.1 hypothetical protein BW723_03855 [Polaribacter reichenbachii]AUC19345.1 hypothetical protein BTO17_11860 [Polaribacter reichenbachii]OBY63501.1 hypothetical protein LPB301_11850 [Polaribacter reichenbachii]